MKRYSPKSSKGMPSFFNRLKLMPQFSNKVIDSEEWSSLSLSNFKLNCHVDVLGGRSPFEFVKVIPSWIKFNLSTFVFTY